MPKEQAPSWRFSSLRLRSRTQQRLPVAAEAQLFFWARNGLYHGLRALGLSPGAHVLLPAYLCTAAVEPFSGFGADVDFYGIDRNCRPDLEELEAKIGPRTGAVLAVHYFGFPQKIHEIRNLCDRKNIALIEDCAHVLRGDSGGIPLGTIGDVAVFSWRKFLPLYDGAALQLNRRAASVRVDWNSEGLLFSAKIAKCIFERALERRSAILARFLIRALGQTTKVFKRAAAIDAGDPLVAVESSQTSFDPSLVNQPMSRVSRYLLAHSDLDAIVARRRENFLYLLSRLQGIKAIQTLHSELPSNVCPWVLPMYFESAVDAHLLLRKAGVPATTWGGVRPAILGSGRYPDAEFLYRNLIFLPIHQDLGPDSLDRIVEVVADIADTLPNRPSVEVGGVAVGL